MSYTMDFKKNAVLLLSNLNEVGFVYFKGKRITNVRELVKELGCSSGSLYSWDKKFSEKELYGYDSEYNKEDHEYPKELFQNPIEKQEVQKSVNREVKINNASHTDKDIFGLRFYGWMAKAKGIKGYSKMKLDQLKYELGKQLIQESGIAKSNIPGKNKK